jgi:type IV secretory pathway VirB10-like protein
VAEVPSPQPSVGNDPPPPLTDVRVKGPGARGLNKPALLVVAGGGFIVVLVAASGGLSSDPSRKPAEAKPTMSAPARPEIAQGAVKDLPATYEQAAVQQAARETRRPPLLGPPLPGDVAAFAPRLETSGTEVSQDWMDGNVAAPPDRPDPAMAEADQARRSQLFFTLRQTNRPSADASADTPTKPRDPLTVLRQERPVTTAAAIDQRVLFPGAVIAASLVTEINSEAPGPVIAQITQTTYDSATGRIAVIPQGARLIGEYRSASRQGQSRVVVFWSRIIMPNGEEVALDETSLGSSGAAGLSGKVDNHWEDIFGAAALGALISIGVATTEDPHMTFGQMGVTTRDPVEQALNEGIQRSASAITNRVVDRSLAIPPTIRVAAGQRMAVIVTRRLSI